MSAPISMEDRQNWEGVLHSPSSSPQSEMHTRRLQILGYAMEPIEEGKYRVPHFLQIQAHVDLVTNMLKVL